MPPTRSRITDRFRPQKRRSDSTHVLPKKEEEEEKEEKEEEEGEEGEEEEEEESVLPPCFPSGFCDAFKFVTAPIERTSPPLRSSSRHKCDGAAVVKQEAEKTTREYGKRVKHEASSAEQEELPEVPDHVRDNLDILFIGSNPGRMSSKKGQHFGHPSNHFYRALHRSGLTPLQLHPSQDYSILHQQPPLLSLGLTNLAARPTRMAQEVNKSEHAVGTQILLALIRQHRPRIGVFVGIGVAKAFEQHVSKEDPNLIGNAKLRVAVKREDAQEQEVESDNVFVSVPESMPLVADTTLGLGVGLMMIGVRHGRLAKLEAPGECSGAQQSFTLLFTCPSTSGRVTSHQLPQKVECMRQARILTESLAQANCSTAAAPSSSNKTVCIQLV